MIDLYGIPNCDTMKKARKWLADNGIEYQFHDYKKEGVDAGLLHQWEQQVGWEILLNRRGMMWRKLSDEQKNTISRETALEIMQQIPSIIKRPVLVLADGTVNVGFKEEDYKKLLG